MKKVREPIWLLQCEVATRMWGEGRINKHRRKGIHDGESREMNM